jgi:hypothetical protein
LLLIFTPIALGIWGVARCSNIRKYSNLQQIKEVTNLNIDNIVSADGLFLSFKDTTSWIHLVIKENNLNDFLEANCLEEQLTFDKQRIKEIFDDIRCLPMENGEWIEESFLPVFALEQNNDVTMLLLVGGTNATTTGIWNIYIME